MGWNHQVFLRGFYICIYIIYKFELLEVWFVLFTNPHMTSVICSVKARNLRVEIRAPSTLTEKVNGFGSWYSRKTHCEAFSCFNTTPPIIPPRKNPSTWGCASGYALVKLYSFAHLRGVYFSGTDHACGRPFLGAKNAPMIRWEGSACSSHRFFLGWLCPSTHMSRGIWIP